MEKKSKRKRTGGGGPVQKKIMLLLLGGLSLGLSRSPRQYFRVLNAIQKEWNEINRDALTRAIRSLYKSQLVDTVKNKDGTMTLVLSKNGERIALTYDIEKIHIKKPNQWDKLWRIVMFDIPEPNKKVRDSLRFHLKSLGFCELQKSVFVHPFPCLGEIDYIVEFYNIRRHVRYITAKEIDNELHLKKKFSLL